MKDFQFAAILLLMDSRKRLLFIQRTKNVPTHKNQIAFPGGRKEEEDSNFIETAIRETQEEIGLEQKHYRIIRELDVSFSPRGFCVYPFLGKIITQQPLSFSKNKEEVKRIIRIPLLFFLQNKPYQRIFLIKKKRILIPFYRFGPHIIWGATARIIYKSIKKNYFASFHKQENV